MALDYKQKYGGSIPSTTEESWQYEYVTDEEVEVDEMDEGYQQSIKQLNKWKRSYSEHSH